MPGARWFEGAELNYAENLLAPLRHERADGGRIARETSRSCTARSCASSTS